MKHYQKTLMELEFKLNLSQVGACANCYAAEFHGTKKYAKAAVAKHRAISKDIRQDLQDLVVMLDRYDADVERQFSKVVALNLSEETS